MDVAAHADGMCPLCLADEIKRLRAALKEIADGSGRIPSGGCL
jgi:hypothetical protein